MKKNRTLNKKLKKYSMLSAAFLLSAPFAKSAIIETDIVPDETYGIGQGIDIDFDGDGFSELRIQQNGACGGTSTYTSYSTPAFGGTYTTYPCTSKNPLFPDCLPTSTSTSSGNGVVSATPLNGAAVMGTAGGWAYPSALFAGASVGSSQSFPIVGTAGNNTALNSYSNFGNWTGGVDAYIGCQFFIGEETHYGYVHLEVVGPCEFILKDYAYESTPNLRILIPAAPLSVELSEFNALAVDNHINLNWQTETEVQNKGFELQRATDDLNWQTISWIDGQGTTTNKQNYSFDDITAKVGIQYYYRLRQVDLDGKTALSEIKSATIHREGFAVGQVYPNPASNNKIASLDFYSPVAQTGIIQIIDSQGKVIQNTSLEIPQAGSKIDLDLQNLNAGIYFIKIRAGENTVFRKIAVQ